MRPTRPGVGASATSFPSTPATSSSANCAGCGGASTAARRRTSARRVLRRVPRSGRPARSRRRTRAARLRGARAPGPSPTPPSPPWCSGCGSPRRCPNPCTLSPCAARSAIEPQRRRYEPARRPACSSCSASPRMGRLAAAVPVDPRRHGGPAFTATIEVDLPVACTYDFEVAAAKYLHGSTTARSPLAAVLRGPCSVGPSRRVLGRPGPGTRRRRSGCPSPCGGT